MVKVISGSTVGRFQSRVNHEAYCSKWGYEYVDDDKARKLESVYDHKLSAISDLPIDNKWCFWLDNDAFHKQFEKQLQPLIKVAYGNFELFSFEVRSVLREGGPVFPQGIFSLE